MTDIKIDFLIKDLWNTVIEYVDGDIITDLDLDKLDWDNLSRNPSAVYILEKESEKKFDNSYIRINWIMLAENHSPIAMKLLEKNLHLLDDDDFDFDDNNFDFLMSNPFAIDIIEKNFEKVDFGLLCENKSEWAVRIIKKHIENTEAEDIMIDWKYLSSNPYAMDIIENNINTPTSQVDWKRLSSNSSSRAIKILENNLDKLDWSFLSSNPSAIYILEKNLNNVNWHMLNQNPYAITILEKNLDKIDWKGLSTNRNAIHILEKNLDKIDWSYLSNNPNAIHILEKNMDKIDWHYLSDNPNAIHILEKNMNKIDYKYISSNDKFFKEYPTIKLRRLLNIN